MERSPQKSSWGGQPMTPTPAQISETEAAQEGQPQGVGSDHAGFGAACHGRVFLPGRLLSLTQDRGPANLYQG